MENLYTKTVRDSKGNEKLIFDEKRYVFYFCTKYNVKCYNNVLYSVNGVMSDTEALRNISLDVSDYIPLGKHIGAFAKNVLVTIKTFLCEKMPKPDINKIHFINGTLSKDDKGLYTVWSEEKEPCINCIQTRYNPNAKEPTNYLKYLKDVYNDYDIETLLEYAGCCLIPDKSEQLSLFILGEGGEGKSTFGEILIDVIGEKNCYVSNIERLNNRFELANTENKLVFFVDDLYEKGLNQSNNFKTLVGFKGKLSAEKKGIQSNEIYSYCRIVACGNMTLKALYDNSKGFERKLINIKAKTKDKNRADEKYLSERIVKEESEGILKLLVDKLNTCKERGKLFVSTKTSQMNKLLLNEYDSVYLWLTESGDVFVNTRSQEFTRDLYCYYRFFCERILNENPLSMDSFSRKLANIGEEHGIKKANGNIRKGERTGKGFHGIKIDR